VVMLVVCARLQLNTECKIVLAVQLIKLFMSFLIWMAVGEMK
jgi:hypothetical protein